MTTCPVCGATFKHAASLGGHYVWHHTADLPTPAEPAGDWVEHAACKGLTDIFFPDVEDDARSSIAAAKAVCAVCPVIAPCRDWAIRTGENHGIWGGLTTHERKIIRWPSKSAPRRRAAGVTS